MNIIHYVNVVHNSSDRLTRRRLARRDRLLELALQLIDAEGLPGLTMARLAGRAGLAVGALYRTFPGKGALLVALQARAIAGLEAEVRQEVSAADAALPAKLKPRRRSLRLLLAALRPFLESHRRSPARHRLIDDLLSAPEALLSADELAEVNAALAPLLRAVVDQLDAAAKAGALEAGSGPLRARVLWAALHGLDHLRKRDRGEPRALRSPALSAELLRALLVGFGARPADVDEVNLA